MRIKKNSAPARIDGPANFRPLRSVRDLAIRGRNRCARDFRAFVEAIAARRELIAQAVTAICFVAGIAATILDILGCAELAKLIRIIAGIAATAVSPYTALVIGKAVALTRAAGRAVRAAARRTARCTRTTFGRMARGIGLTAAWARRRAPWRRAGRHHERDGGR